MAQLKDLIVTGDTKLAGKTYGNLTGNADTASKLATSRTISLTGAVTGSGNFDGSGNLSIATSANNASLGQGRGTCDTAASTAAKVVALSNYALATGGIVSVKFTNAVPANATLNINSKGAKSIYYNGSAITAGIINAGDTATFIYDGTQYHVIAIDSIISKALKLSSYNSSTGTLYIVS